MATFHWKVDGELPAFLIREGTFTKKLLYFFRGGGWLLYNSPFIHYISVICYTLTLAIHIAYVCILTISYATPSIFTRAGPWPCYSGACLFWIVGIMGKQWLPQPSRISTGQQYIFFPFFRFRLEIFTALKAAPFKNFHGIFGLKNLFQHLTRRNSVTNSSLAICFSSVAILGGKAVALQGMPLTWTWRQGLQNLENGKNRKSRKIFFMTHFNNISSKGVLEQGCWELQIIHRSRNITGRWKVALRNVMMSEGFWSRDFSVTHYGQLYYMLACWQATGSRCKNFQC